jgi:hypothetical protein
VPSCRVRFKFRKFSKSQHRPARRGPVRTRAGKAFRAPMICPSSWRWTHRILEISKVRLWKTQAFARSASSDRATSTTPGTGTSAAAGDPVAAGHMRRLFPSRTRAPGRLAGFAGRREDSENRACCRVRVGDRRRRRPRGKFLRVGAVDRGPGIRAPGEGCDRGRKRGCEAGWAGVLHGSNDGSARLDRSQRGRGESCNFHAPHRCSLVSTPASERSGVTGRWPWHAASNATHPLGAGHENTSTKCCRSATPIPR